MLETTWLRKQLLLPLSPHLHTPFRREAERGIFWGPGLDGQEQPGKVNWMLKARW
jgi:hypothetical protein